MSALDVVNRFYEVTDNRALDELRDLVADDVTFEGLTGPRLLVHPL